MFTRLLPAPLSPPNRRATPRASPARRLRVRLHNPAEEAHTIGAPAPGSPQMNGDSMLEKSLFVTTALVVGISPSFAARTETSTPADANALFLSWYGGTPMAGAKYSSKVLYEQSASSGFSTYAVRSDNFQSSSGYCCWGYLAADDFILPGMGTHKITAVYARGAHISGYAEPSSMRVTFYDRIK